MHAAFENWYVYMLHCADNSLYTGMAKDLQKRLEEHRQGKPNAARYTRGRRPVKLVYCETWPSRSAACRREAAIKKLTRPQKHALLIKYRHEEPLDVQ